MRRFEPRLIPFVATCIGAVIFLRLGWWQWTKAEHVEEVAAAFEARHGQNPMPIGAEPIDPARVDNMPVWVKGTYDASGQFFLDNKQEQGRPGLHVITPLRIENSSYRVLVNRGWVGWGASRNTLPSVEVPVGEVQVRGLAHIPSHKKFFLVSEDVGSTAQLKTRLDLARLSQDASYPLHGFVIEQEASNANDTLIRHWPAPENKAMMHRGYALQWVLITLGLIVFFIISSFRAKPDASA